MIGFEASGSAAIVRNEVVENPETLAIAIRIGNPESWGNAVDAAKESKGFIDEVTDERLWKRTNCLLKKKAFLLNQLPAVPLPGR